MKKSLLLFLLALTPAADGAIILLGGFDGNQTEDNSGTPRTLTGAVQDASAVGNVTVTLEASPTTGFTGFDWAAGFQSSNANWGLQSFTPAANTSNNNAVYASDTPTEHHLVSMIITNTGSDDIVLNSLHMRIKRDGANSPTGLDVSYAGGDLSGGSDSFVIAGGVVQYDFSLSGVLTDSTLSAGETATITWITTGGTGQRIRFDNVAISGEVIPEPSALLLGGLGSLLLLRRRRA